MTPENAARFWQTASRSLARRINLGWWLDRWMTWIMAGTGLGVIAVLLFRWNPVVELRWVWLGIATVLLLGTLVAWRIARSKFETPTAARIRLEDALGLKTRLTAAEAGVGSWPIPPESITWPVRWRWQRPLAIVCFSAAMLFLAAHVPISPKEAKAPRVIEKPSAVKVVEQWVENLRQEKVAEEKSLEDIEEKINELIKRPSENWYEHASLEAAENLQEQTAEMLQELAQNLADAERAASALEAAGNTLPQAAKDALQEQLTELANSLSAGGLKPNEQMLEQLSQLAQQQGQSLSKEQLQKLSQQLKDLSDSLEKALENSPGLKMASSGKSKKGKGKGEGPDGTEPGKGGPSRGPGTAPLTFNPDETSLGTQKTEHLSSNIDANRAAPGDLMGTRDGRHRVDENAYQGPSQSAGINDTGDGGSAVWQNSLLPSEREALKRYFQ